MYRYIQDPTTLETISVSQLGPIIASLTTYIHIHNVIMIYIVLKALDQR